MESFDLIVIGSGSGLDISSFGAARGLPEVVQRAFYKRPP